jgi:PhoPQ-activated pathogenicity-related protein
MIALVDPQELKHMLRPTIYLPSGISPRDSIIVRQQGDAMSADEASPKNATSQNDQGAYVTRQTRPPLSSVM